MALADRKIAVTGATGIPGEAVRTILAERDVPADRLRLLERSSDEAIISEYAGQATLIASLEEGSLADRDLVFLCGGVEESARCLSWKRKPGALFVDLSGASASRRDVPLVNAAVNAESLGGHPALVAAPHPISCAVTSVLAPIDRELGIEEVNGVVLRPVSDFGEPGIEELHRQTVSLLNFSTVPKRVFRRQMAFNVLPQPALDDPADGAGLDARLREEIGRVLGWTAARASLRTLVAPVFLGHAVMVHARLRTGSGPAAIGRILESSLGLPIRASHAEATPVEISGGEHKLVVHVAADGLASEGIWLWIVGADFTSRAARNAVEIAARVTAH